MRITVLHPYQILHLQPLVKATEKRLKDSSLGLRWNIDLDSVIYHISEMRESFTRRGVLSVVSNVFDHLGLLAPIILGGRLFPSVV